MGRIIKAIEIEDQQAVALFDTGAVYTYVLSSLAENTARKSLRQPVQVVLGGQEIDIQELCIIEGEIEGLNFFTDVVPVPELGVAEGYELDAIIGARTMEQWEIKLDPKNGTLDLEGLRRREFTEF